MISREKLQDFAILAWIKLDDPVEYRIDIETQEKTKRLVALMLDAHKKAWDSELIFKK